MTQKPIGVLALQGDFAAHGKRMEDLGFRWKPVLHARDLQHISAIILPGGESSALLKLCTSELRTALQNTILSGIPTLATCAGLILLAKQVSDPQQESLQLLDVDVSRNAYGRQIDSFITPELEWSPEAKKLSALALENRPSISRLSAEGVFIRAPKITRLGTSVSTLATHHSEPVLIMQNNILGASFHPELSEGISLAHAILLSLIERN